jgi:hypothetical protein
MPARTAAAITRLISTDDGNFRLLDMLVSDVWSFLKWMSGDAPRGARQNPKKFFRAWTLTVTTEGHFPHIILRSEAVVAATKSGSRLSHARTAGVG